jgi:hypothetical protein
MAEERSISFRPASSAPDRPITTKIASERLTGFRVSVRRHRYYAAYDVVYQKLIRSLRLSDVSYAFAMEEIEPTTRLPTAL